MNQVDILNLPKDWEENAVKKFVDLGVIFKPLDGNHGEIHPLKDDYVVSGIPFIMSRDIIEGVVDDKNCKFISKKQADSLRTGFAINGDVLLSHKGTIGSVAILQTNYEYVVLTPQITYYRIKDHNKFYNRFIYYYFLSPKFQCILNDIAKGGSTRAYIGITKQLTLPLIFAPLKEQQRIVAILDEAFAAIAKAKANAEQNLKNAKELFESYLQSVFASAGSATKEDWETKSLKDITTKIGSGATPRGGNKSYKAEGISLVRSMNVHDSEFRERKLAFIDEQQAKELNNVALQENDVLLNITGASVARCCVMPIEYLPARVNQHVSIIRAKIEIIDPHFLNLLLTSRFYKDQLLLTGEQGATRQAITKAQLEAFKIAYPRDLRSQQEIVQKLDDLSVETKKLETIYQTKINDLAELKKSILQKAFSGEF